jgi:hypothetical protein
MPNVQQWGRNESLIWPPRGYLYTLGAFFLACVATGFFVYLASNMASRRLNDTTCLTTCAARLRARASGEHLPDALCFRWSKSLGSPCA